MAKNAYPTVFTNLGTLAFAYIAKRDDQAPKGASWKPDGKYKGTLVFTNEDDAANVREACVDLLKAEFGDKLPDLSECHFPVNPGEGDEFDGKTLLQAKTDYQPSVYDATGGEVPKGVFPFSGDKVKFKVSLFPFSKTEKVRENGKMVDTTLYGVSLRLLAVQIVEKGSGGGGGGFGAVEGGYVASAEDARPARGEKAEDKPERTTPRGGGGDF